MADERRDEIFGKLSMNVIEGMSLASPIQSAHIKRI